jgi:hypothetical protein
MNKTIFTNHFIFPLTVMVLMFCLSGCVSSTKAWKPIQSRQKLKVHIVQWQGETLPMIAKWYTDSSQNWKKLANANPNIVPGHLSAGDRILLPNGLLKTSKEMPQDFIKTFIMPTPATPIITTPSKKAPSPHEEDEFELFGPK